MRTVHFEQSKCCTELPLGQTPLLYLFAEHIRIKYSSAGEESIRYIGRIELFAGLARYVDCPREIVSRLVPGEESMVILIGRAKLIKLSVESAIFNDQVIFQTSRVRHVRFRTGKLMYPVSMAFRQ